MRTSKQWWDETKADPVKLIAWLKDQYHGEITAAVRIGKLAFRFKNKTLKTIADQELQHAEWIDKLLSNRGIHGEILQKEERYWERTLPFIDLNESRLEEIAAVGAHAEKMRLERIEVIAMDEAAPWDIRETFLKIWPEEIFHAEAFTEMTTDECLEVALENHNEGMNALGLIA